MNQESPNPHTNEEELQRATDLEAVRYGNKRYDYQETVDDTDLGGNSGPEISPSLPDGKTKAFYIEGAKMLVDENIAKRNIRANKARSDADLPPIELT
jgi:hypothetical protein